VSFNEKRLTIEESISDPKSHSLTGKEGHGEEKKKGKLFDLTYDKLVVAVGCYSQTFNTPGVRENALFLKDVVDARKIRKRLLECKSPFVIITASMFTLPITSAAARPSGVSSIC
jgi:NADH dehydrogenase FAD-containing subunit